MSSDLISRTVYSPAQVALDGAADRMVFNPGRPVQVLRWGYTVSVVTTGTGLVLKLDKTDLAGTRGDGDMGTITAGAVDVLGSGRYTEVVSPSATITTEPHVLTTGEYATIQVTGAATTGDGFVWIEYQDLPFVDGRLPDTVNGSAHPTATTHLQFMTKMTA